MSCVASILVGAAKDGDLPLIEKHYSRNTSLGTINKMCKWALRSRDKAQNEDAKRAKRAFLSQLSFVLFERWTETHDAQIDFAVSCIDSDLVYTLECLLRYYVWLPEDLYAVYVASEQDQRVLDMFDAPTNKMWTAEMRQRFEDMVANTA